MTGMVWSLGEQRFTLLADTLVSDASDRRPLATMTKVYLVSHLKGLIFGTGIADPAHELFWSIAQQSPLRDIRQLTEHAPGFLAGYWDFLHLPPDQTATVYTVGWADDAQKFVGFAYRSTNGFLPEPMAYGMAFKPPPDDRSLLGGVESVDDMVRVMRAIKDDDRAKPEADRIGIGGDIVLYEMHGQVERPPAFVTMHIDRYPEFESDWGIMAARLNERHAA